MATVSAKKVYFIDNNENILIPHTAASVVDSTTASTIVVKTCTRDEYNTWKLQGTLDPKTLYYVTDDVFEKYFHTDNFPLFTPHWQDHLTNDASWLRADTFSWHSGGLYISAYQHLADEYDENPSTTETVAGTTITYRRANDGHKIVDASQESKVADIYAATGVAWYYILDTVNTRFKLPRSRWSFVGLRNSVGDYVEAGLPNITGNFSFSAGTVLNGNGAFSLDTLGVQALGVNASATPTQYRQTFDASRSSDVYGNSDTVQQKATQMYLYFYVGNTIRKDTIIQLGELLEACNDALDGAVLQVGSTMTGELTVHKAREHIISQDTELDVNITPASNIYGGYYTIRDKNNLPITRLSAGNIVDGFNQSMLQVWSGGETAAAGIGVKIKQDGTSAIGFAPTPAANSNSTDIATTAWVRSYASSSCSIISTGGSGRNRWRKWSDGRIEQWGYFNGSTTINFHTPFTDVNSIVFVGSNPQGSGRGGYRVSVVSYTTTGVNVQFGYGDVGQNASGSCYWYATGY